MRLVPAALAVALLASSLPAQPLSAPLRLAPFRTANGPRTDLGTVTRQGSGYAVFVTHVTPTLDTVLRWTPVDASGHPQLERTRIVAGVHGTALAASSGSRALLAWQDGSSLRVSVVNDDGSLATPDNVAITNAPNADTFACNDRRCIASWRQTLGPPPNHRWAAILDAAGRLVEPPFQVGTGGWGTGVAAAADDGGFLLLHDEDEWKATSIDEDGRIRFDSPLPDTAARSVAVDFDGTDYVVAWNDAITRTIDAAKVHADGGWSTPVTLFTEVIGFGMRIAWNGSEHILLASRDVGFSVIPEILDTSDMLVARLRPDLSAGPSGTFPPLAYRNESPSGIAFGEDGSFYVVWRDAPTADMGLGSHVMGALFTPYAFLRATTSFSTAPLPQTDARIAATPRGGVVVWREKSDPLNSVRGMRIEDLERSDAPAPVTVVEDDEIGLLTFDTAASGGDVLFVTASRMTPAPTTARIFRDGQPLSSAPALHLYDGAADVAVAGSDDGWLVAGTRGSPSAAIVRRDGTTRQISADFLIQGVPVVVASDGKGWATAQRECVGCGIAMTILDQDGTVVAHRGVEHLISSSPVALAGSTSGYLLDTGLQIVPLDRQGNQIGPGLAFAAPVARGSAAPYRGGWIVGWTDLYGQKSRYAFVDATATTVQGDVIDLPDDELLWSLASDGAGGARMVTSIVAEHPLGPELAVFARSITTVPRGRPLRP